MLLIAHALFEEARVICEEIGNRNRLAIILTNIGECYYSNSQPHKAIEVLRKAEELEPDNPQYQIALARVLLQLDRETECSEIVEKLESRGFLERMLKPLHLHLSQHRRVSVPG